MAANGWWVEWWGLGALKRLNTVAARARRGGDGSLLQSCLTVPDCPQSGRGVPSIRAVGDGFS